MSATGYWVALVSFGQVRVIRLNPYEVIATVRVVGWDATRVHTIEAAAKGANLQVTVDGAPINFTQAVSGPIVPIPATGESNDGAASIAFCVEDNRGGTTKRYRLLRPTVPIANW